MTSSEFERLAKTAVAKVMKAKHGITVKYEDLELVWFAHELGNKKCMIYGPALGLYYPEVTYNADKQELYVDVYIKRSNTVFHPKRS